MAQTIALQDADGGLEAKAASKEKFLVLPIVVLIMAQMGTSGDNGAVALATSALTNDLGASMTDIQLVNMVYSLAAGALMVAGGLVGTVIGWKKNFRIGALLCVGGEFLMAFAPSITVFIWGGRLLTGFGASFMIPSVLGLVPRIYQGKNRVMAFGCIGAATGLSTVIPVILGIIMDAAGFRVTFGILGCYLLVVLGMSFLLPPIAESSEKPKFDIVGTILAALGLFLLLIGLSRISAWGLIEPYAGCPFTVFGISPCLPLAFVGLVVLAVMIKLEKGIEAKNGIALLPQSFLKTPQVLAGLVASAIIFFYMMSLGAVVLNPYLQLVCGWPATIVGLMSVLLGIPMFILSMGIPRFLPNANPRMVLRIGYVLAIVALVPFFMAIRVEGVSAPFMVCGFVLAGVAAGVLSSHANNVVALALNERDAAQSGGIQATMRNVGQAVGVAVLGTVLLFGITSAINSAAVSDAAVSPQVAEAVSERNITLMGDADFEKAIADIPMTSEEKDALVSVNATARVDASHITLIVVGVVLVLALLTTPMIKIFKKEDEKEAGAQSTGQAKNEA